MGGEGNMRRRHGELLAVAIGALMAVTLPGRVGAIGDQMSNKQIAETIAKVRAGDTVTIRTKHAEQLAVLIAKIGPKGIDDKTLSNLLSLLDAPDDSVRAFVAAALGTLGPRAKAAIPKLEQLLPAADCLQGTLTSADAIRQALTRMGVTPPPPAKCKTTGGPR
jgi:endonuclease YncB( thermonuclease family)